jgi:hypothetical protein
VAIALRVHPVPTTFLSKIISSEARVASGGLFYETLQERVQMLFFRRHAIPAPILWIYFSLVLVAAASVRVRHAGAVVVLAAALAFLWRAPGNFLWYPENLAILLIAVCASIVLVELGTIRTWIRVRTWRTALRAARLVVVASALVLFVGTCFLRNRDMFWNLRAPHSRGLTYKTIGEHVGPDARFTFGGLPQPAYLLMGEIGMVGYFGGTKAWIFDEAGLAQPGQLLLLREHRLSRFVPDSLKRSCLDELSIVMEKLGETEAFLYRAHGDPSPQDVTTLCTHYDPTSGVCLQLTTKALRKDKAPGTENVPGAEPAPDTAKAPDTATAPRKDSAPAPDAPP